MAMLFASSLVCTIIHVTHAQMVSTEGIDIDDIFPSWLYDTSELTPEFPIFVGVCAGLLCLIVLVLGIGCCCLERKRRQDVETINEILNKEKVAKIRKLEAEQKEREIKTELSMQGIEDKDVWSYESQEQLPTDNSNEKPISAHVTPNEKSPSAKKNWGVSSRFLF